MRPGTTLLAATTLALLATSADTATITLNVQDPAGTGFNDTTPVSPVPGNSGTTRGQQRLNVFQAAADVWGAKLRSTVTITVDVAMGPLECSPRQLLGQAGPNQVFRDFAGAARPATYYVGALANSLANARLSSAFADIDAAFNGDVDTGTCISGITWWYGINSPAPSNRINFFEVVLHELGHGLGFLALVGQTGQKFLGFDDAFMVNLEDHSLGMTWPSMTDAQRASSTLDTGDLHWVGSNVTSRSATLLSAGVAVQGHVRMYAPNPFEGGSSVSHWDVSLTPDELMEPFATPSVSDLVTTHALRDTGWQLANVNLSIADRTVAEGSAANAAFLLTLDAPSTQTVTVNYATANGTAVAPGDYTSTSGTVTFSPGRTTQSVFVPIATDTTPEGLETFSVNLSNAVNATIADGQATGTINDPPVAAKVAMYRAYNTGTDYHFFTTDLASKDFAVGVLKFRDESSPIPFYVWNTQQTGTVPLFRMYNPNLGRHFYTAETASRDFLIGIGMSYEKDEGFIFPAPAAGATELFKLYNNNSGTHLFTADANQKNFILATFPGVWVLHTSVGYVFTLP